MKQYRVINRPLFLKSGILGLTKAQADPRKIHLKPLRGGKYEITGEVCFKVGEVIAMEQPAGKAAARHLEEIGAVETVAQTVGKID